MKIQNKNLQAFTKLDRGKYKDNYVAIVDGKIKFWGKDIKKILEKIKTKYPKKIPFVAKIPREEVMVLILIK